MRISTLSRWLLALLLLLGSRPGAWATHMLGGDISYTSIPSTTPGVPRYHVVLRRFELDYADGMVNLTLLASRGSCAAPLAGSFSAVAPRTQLVYITSGCTTSPLQYRIAYNEVDVNLPAGEWVLSYAEYNRNSGIANIVNAGFQTFYMSAYLDNTIWTQDASPKVESFALPNVSTTMLSPYSLSAFDADGDSLRYELTTPMGSCTQALATTTAIHYALNTSTGQMQPIATSSSTQGLYNVTLRVSEYRRFGTRWVMLGAVSRESIYSLYATTNQPPAFTSMQVNSGAAQPLGTAIALLPGQTMQVALQATDPDASQQISFASNAVGTVPGLSLARIGTTNGVQLTWQVPATLPAGRYNIPVTVFDNNCPFSASEERTLTFVVASTALATRAAATATDVYPVPFREQVQFTTAPNQAVILVDALGREVARLTSAPSGLVRWQPAPTLPAGLYLARAASTGQPLARLLRAE
jgi:hypothetical protein